MIKTRSFDDWFSTMRKSINTYKYYTDFEKVYKNAEKLKVEICILQSLVNSKNIENDFENILIKYPECLKAIPILLAVRQNEIFCKDDSSEIIYKFDERNQSVEQYKYFMRKTGLFEMLQNHVIANLYDYVTGVEVGLDTNSRKNRGGHQMENLVESYIKKSGIEYFKEKYSNWIKKNLGYNLSAISNKRWDFVAKMPSEVFVIETNFYTDGGSKLNETARSYKKIAEEVAQIENVNFVWVTDGEGWKKSKNGLEEIYKILLTLYNIRDLEDGIFYELFKIEKNI